MAFTGNDLDRAGNLRAEPDWVAARLRTGLFLPFWHSMPLVAEDKAVFLPWRDEWEGAACVFLGLDGAQALFAVAAPEELPPVAGTFMEMRAAAFILPARQGAIAGEGKALLHWHQHHSFCSNCGFKTQMRDGGWRRVCPHCSAEHFPRTDPVVIMLPVFEDRCLVGRNARFPGNLYSAFAGFVEPGETMEEAVSRELREEVNLKVGAIRYHRSQPWPFPSSLMLGCYADALTPDFRIDGVEIVDARWLTKEQARKKLAGTITDDMAMPGAIAITHRLVRDWAGEDASAPSDRTHP